MDQNEPKERVHDASESEKPNERQAVGNEGVEDSIEENEARESVSYVDKPAEPIVDSNENAEDLPSDPTQGAPLKESWISRHHKAIIAWSAMGSLLTTAVLAVIAYYSWDEVRKQRDLAYKQFVIAHSPAVGTYVSETFKFNEGIASSMWYVTNKGGYVKDIEYKSLILCCGNEIKNPETTKVILDSTIRPRLNKGEQTKIRLAIDNAEDLAWLKPALEDKSGINVYLYLQAKYTIPAELSITGKPVEDSTYSLYVWVAKANRFEDVKERIAKSIISKIHERGYLKDNEE